MSSYQIEMLWQCAICHHRGNRGLKDRYCCSCGHKKDADDSEYMPDDMSESASLSGVDKSKAEVGEDWVCKYCSSLQNQLNKCCGNCGATDRSSTEQQVAAVRVAMHEPPLPDSAQISHRSFAPYAVAAVIAATLGSGGWWLFAPRTVGAVVSGLYWNHNIVIERYQVNSDEGFTPETGAFDVAPVGMRHHHYDRIHVGSHQESYQDSYTCGQSCYTTPRSRSCYSNKNGTATCTNSGGDRVCSPRTCYRTTYRTVQDYADVSRQAMWYTWHAWGWRYNRTVAHDGHTKATRWPSADELRPSRIGDGERERYSRAEGYIVTFSFGDEHVSITPKTEGEFSRYDLLQKHQLKITRAGSVEVVTGSL